MQQNWQENTCVGFSLFLGIRPGTCKFIKKEALKQMFSGKFHEIFKNTIFYRTSLVAASTNNNSNTFTK